MSSENLERFVPLDLRVSSLTFLICFCVMMLKFVFCRYGAPNDVLLLARSLREVIVFLLKFVDPFELLAENGN